jgi:hypothetical protein
METRPITADLDRLLKVEVQLRKQLREEFLIPFRWWPRVHKQRQYFGNIRRHCNFASLLGDDFL